MRRIDLERILATARLAGLELSREEAQRLTPQFERVLAAFERLQRLDLDGVEPLVTPLEREDVCREDLPREGLDGELLLQQAPRRDGPYFLVPRALGAER